MSKNRKIFIIASIVFFVIVILIAYDMASRTTFPGADKADTAQVQDPG